HDVALVVGDVDAPVGAEGHAVDPGEISVAPLGDELAILRKNLDRDLRAVDDVDAILAVHHHARYLAKRTAARGFREAGIDFVFASGPGRCGCAGSSTHYR